MQEKERDPGEEVEAPLDHAWAVVLSVGLVLVGLFVGLPWLLVRTPVSAWVPLVLLAVPLFPTVTGWLQGEMSCRLPGDGVVRLLVREYLFHLWHLSLELTLLLAGLPVIAARLLGVIAGIMLTVFVIVFLLGGVQQLTGWRMKGVVVFTWADIWLHAKLALGSLAGMLVTLGVGVLLGWLFDRSADRAAAINQRVMRWLRDHV